MTIFQQNMLILGIVLVLLLIAGWLMVTAIAAAVQQQLWAQADHEPEQVACWRITAWRRTICAAILLAVVALSGWYLHPQGDGRLALLLVICILGGLVGLAAIAGLINRMLGRLPALIGLVCVCLLIVWSVRLYHRAPTIGERIRLVKEQHDRLQDRINVMIPTMRNRLDEQIKVVQVTIRQATSEADRSGRKEELRGIIRDKVALANYEKSCRKSLNQIKAVLRQLHRARDAGQYMAELPRSLATELDRAGAEAVAQLTGNIEKHVDHGVVGDMQIDDELAKVKHD